jgi:hypothetical protein
MRKRRERDGQKESHWLEMIRRQAESGQSVRGYCHQTGIRESAFHWWRRELARRSQQDKNFQRLPGVVRRQATERPLPRKSVGTAGGLGYTPTHQRDGPAKFLKDYRGYLQADAFNGYDGIYLESQGRIIEVACCPRPRI